MCEGVSVSRDYYLKIAISSQRTSNAAVNISSGLYTVPSEYTIFLIHWPWCWSFALICHWIMQSSELRLIHVIYMFRNPRLAFWVFHNTIYISQDRFRNRITAACLAHFLEAKVVSILWWVQMIWSDNGYLRSALEYKIKWYKESVESYINVHKTMIRSWFCSPFQLLI